MKRMGCTAALVAGLLVASSAAAVDVQRYVQKDKFEEIKLSPNGDYYAATVPLENYTALAIVRRSDSKLTGSFSLGKNSHVQGFWWVNPRRVVISVAQKFGQLDQPQLTGELFAMDFDGGKAEILIGARVDTMSTGTHIQTKKVDRVAAFLVDDLAHDDKNVVISVMPFNDDPFTRAERLDVYSGRRVPLAAAPVRNADFVTDGKGVVRFASGAGIDNARKLYYRAGDGADWQLIADEGKTGLRELPLGFSADDTKAYLQVEHPQGPDSIVELDARTLARRELLRDAVASPGSILYQNGDAVAAGAMWADRSSPPMGAIFEAGKPRAMFFDRDSPDAKLQGMLERSFTGDRVRITSKTADGTLALVQVSSDRNPGDFYIFNTVGKKADYLLSRRDWFDPETMATARPVSLASRDKLMLHGYLTLPRGAEDRKPPLVVMPHGGPFGIQDKWEFDSDVQMLAEAGYAVLQVNFRGSGGYGMAFEQAGARQWGGRMQDDLTDATRWAIAEGFADPSRICIYGGSYGAYAALMGVAKEPDLYRCAVGYVGVYDLPTMHTHGDIQRRGSGETYLKEWIGEREGLAASSPNRMADRIRVPVLLAAGGEDERAPITHSRLMERALRKAGVPVETLYFDTEGHGFYVEKNRVEYYTRLLAFLSRHLGGKVATTSAGAATAASK